MANNKQDKIERIEIKQSFLASAISDISTYIQLTDTKVSIIMAAVVAIIVGIASCYELIGCSIVNIEPQSWSCALFKILVGVGAIEIVLVFLFGILTIRGHYCDIKYKSKWFLSKSTKEYSFDEFSKDVNKMTNEDVIKNMAAELYKLNDINRQKMKTFKWTLGSFSMLLIAISALVVLLFMV